MTRIEQPEFPIEGGCVCGAVRYRITAPPLSAYNCHCRDCQKMSGATHSMSMPMARDNLEHLSGMLVAYDKPSDSGRVVRMMACSQCGTKLWNEPLASPAMRVLKPGTLDDASWIRPVGNIWTSSALPWASVDPELVNFPGQPADRQPLFDAWTAATKG